MTNDIDIKLLGDKEFLVILQNLDYATQHKVLKAILTDTSNKTLIPAMKQVTPEGPTGNLRKSIGNVMGRSKRNATVFVGPRMSHKKTAAGSDKYKGWVANILEFATGDDRRPEKAKSFKPFSGGAGGPEFFKKVKGIKKRTHLTWAIERNVGRAEVYVTKAIRTVIERTAKRKAKQLGLGAYAQAKGR